ncbi:MAG: DUF362 domain-containing protein [Desulfobulbaceae bacterium]|uniref:DUF362 domain-containing protein n=1 Tax=Candidatus Desulfatifera sulfidica TaxID=2841691 RepID=A0A8J6TCL1_9BACT|nr:DUF362 domain-containing protein [Candidatus Desulfatifera sulfidica]
MTHKHDSGLIHSAQLINFRSTLPPLLDAAGLITAINKDQRILIKPNLVENLAPPITTPVSLITELVRYLRLNLPDSTILIGEGTGSLDYDTFHVFDALGYSDLASRAGLELIDLNCEPLSHHQRDDCTRWPEMHLPSLLDEVFLLSVPVLKAHSLAGITLTMKNMMGCAPPSHYQQGGSWGKSGFHHNIQAAILDLNRYRTPDFTLLDASIGMAEAHLWGPHCDPPVNRLAASFDPVAIDAYGCDLLGRDWREIGHIAGNHGILGQAESIAVREVKNP